MIPILYTTSQKLEKNLEDFDFLFNSIRDCPIDLQSKLRLGLEAFSSKIFYSLTLSQNRIEKGQIFEVLTHQKIKRKSEHKLIENYHKALLEIAKNWYLKESGISAKDCEKLYKIACPGDLISDEDATEIKHVLDYIQVSREHPLTRACLAFILINKIEPFTEGNLLFSFLLFDLFLAIDGYTSDNLICLPHFFSDHKKEFEKQFEIAKESENLTSFLEYATFAVNEQLRFVLDVFQQKGTLFRTGLPKSFWRLTKRQKEIASFAQIPQAELTNRKIQALFGVSQITASRDLSKLAVLRMLQIKGQGRSVTYTSF